MSWGWNLVYLDLDESGKIKLIRLGVQRIVCGPLDRNSRYNSVTIECEYQGIHWLLYNQKETVTIFSMT